MNIYNTNTNFYLGTIEGFRGALAQNKQTALLVPCLTSVAGPGQVRDLYKSYTFRIFSTKYIYLREYIWKQTIIISPWTFSKTFPDIWHFHPYTICTADLTFSVSHYIDILTKKLKYPLRVWYTIIKRKPTISFVTCTLFYANVTEVTTWMSNDGCRRNWKFCMHSQLNIKYI